MSRAEPAAGEAIESFGRAGLLLRRLMIRCPVTGRLADTGFEITAMPSVSDAAHVLVDCLECGQDHGWTVEDLCLDEPAVLEASR